MKKTYTATYFAGKGPRAHRPACARRLGRPPASRCAAGAEAPRVALKPQVRRLPGRPHPTVQLVSPAPAAAPTEVLSCQRKCLVKPLVDKASGQIGSAVPAPHPYPARAALITGARRRRPRASGAGARGLRSGDVGGGGRGREVGAAAPGTADPVLEAALAGVGFARSRSRTGGGSAGRTGGRRDGPAALAGAPASPVRAHAVRVPVRKPPACKVRGHVLLGPVGAPASWARASTHLCAPTGPRTRPDYKSARFGGSSRLGPRPGCRLGCLQRRRVEYWIRFPRDSGSKQRSGNRPSSRPLVGSFPFHYCVSLVSAIARDPYRHVPGNLALSVHFPVLQKRKSGSRHPSFSGRSFRSRRHPLAATEVASRVQRRDPPPGPPAPLPSCSRAAGAGTGKSRHGQRGVSGSEDARGPGSQKRPAGAPEPPSLSTRTRARGLQNPPRGSRRGRARAVRKGGAHRPCRPLPSLGVCGFAAPASLAAPRRTPVPWDGRGEVNTAFTPAERTVSPSRG